MHRRQVLAALLAAGLAPAAATIRRGRVLQFPRDHGAHLESRTEWWYATGWCGPNSAPTHGFQVTFFRSLTGLAADSTSRFAARHLLFAHAAVTDLAGRRHLHAQRLARWNGRDAGALAGASSERTDVRTAGWSFVQQPDGRYAARLPGEPLAIELDLAPTQPLLLQGDAGFSRKGPLEAQASHYYSQPHLAARGHFTIDGARVPVAGQGWLDHEWSDEYLHPEADGWDWIGMNLFDGSALMAFRIRRPDGGTVWAGGSFRAPGAAARAFAPEEARFTPGRRWTSPASGAVYPVEWQVDTPAGRFTVRSLLDGQELDSRGSTGAIYWEGLSELLDAGGRRVGLGYLEMTGYAARLRMS